MNAQSISTDRAGTDVTVRNVTVRDDGKLLAEDEEEQADSVTSVFHRHGLNMRYLALVLNQGELLECQLVLTLLCLHTVELNLQRARGLLIQEMAARVLKVMLRRLQRFVAERNASAEAQEAALDELLRVRVLGDSKEADELWSAAMRAQGVCSSCVFAGAGRRCCRS